MPKHETAIDLFFNGQLRKGLAATFNTCLSFCLCPLTFLPLVSCLFLLETLVQIVQVDAINDFCCRRHILRRDLLFPRRDLFCNSWMARKAEAGAIFRVCRRISKCESKLVANCAA